ncbi:hypothetical protein CCHR01_15631 [Colletotrichum chrysophilum]|uniref:Uncharacterized protein n=1 Tax=Colletotrichum chrysophilum TaxID=1836956 RepID=A0AAD9EB75_9PEZI|nr:hypothetical protein CCHR01_15631 [Colletotrichum chrysophilum]
MEVLAVETTILPLAIIMSPPSDSMIDDGFEGQHTARSTRSLSSFDFEETEATDSDDNEVEQTLINDLDFRSPGLHDIDHIELQGTHVPYVVEWKLTANNRTITKDSEHNITITPQALWERQLQEQVQEVLSRKLPPHKTFRPVDSDVVVSGRTAGETGQLRNIIDSKRIICDVSSRSQQHVDVDNPGDLAVFEPAALPSATTPAVNPLECRRDILDIPGLRDDAMKLYTEWHCSIVRDEGLKLDFRRACDVALEDGLDLELIHQGVDAAFFVERGVRRGVALRFTQDIKKWAQQQASESSR